MIEAWRCCTLPRPEFARDVHGVLEKVRGGAEIVIEEDGKPVGVITPPPANGGISPK